MNKKYNITYDYYGKAYLDDGTYTYTNRKRLVHNHLFSILYCGTTYNHVTLNNMYKYTNSELFEAIVYFYCYAKGVSDV